MPVGPTRAGRGDMDKCKYQNITYFFIQNVKMFLVSLITMFDKFPGKNIYMIYIHYFRHDELIKRFLYATAKFEFFTFPKKIPCPFF